MAKLSGRDLDVRGKRVLVRVDFNVPTEVRGAKFASLMTPESAKACRPSITSAIMAENHGMVDQRMQIFADWPSEYF